MLSAHVEFFALFLASVAGGACSRSHSSTASSGSTSGSAAPAASTAAAPTPSDAGPCKKYKACQVLANTDINAALGSHLSSAGSEVGALLPYASGCTYSEPNQAAFHMLISCDPASAKDPDRDYEMSKRGIEIGGHKVTTLSGLGTKPALWGVPSNKDDKIKGYQIEVFFGAYSRLLLTFRPASGGDAEALAAGRQLATTALARL